MAASVRGVLNLSTAETRILPYENGQPLAPSALPVSGPVLIMEELRRLNDGDSIIGAGRLVDRDRDGLYDSVQIDAIESVGLKQLIGRWRSGSWNVVNFIDYETITLERRRPNNNGLTFKPSKVLNYSLFPSNGAYSILLLEKTPQPSSNPTYFPPSLVGSLEVGREKLKLKIFDPKTGETVEELRLSPVSK